MQKHYVGLENKHVIVAKFLSNISAQHIKIGQVLLTLQLKNIKHGF